MNHRPALAALAALLLGPATARADLVRLYDGKTMEGKATLSGNKWTVKGYRSKSATYALSEVKFVEKGACSWEVAAGMARDIPADASDALFVEKHMEVARYLKERSSLTPEMSDLERKEYEAVLKKTPDNEEAHLGLGHLKWAKWWYKSEKERDNARKNAPPADMEPLGYVKYRKTGLWELKEDAEAMDAGKVKFKGRWMTEDEKKEAQGYKKDEKGAWVLIRDLNDRKASETMEKGLAEKPVTVSSSEHFRMISWFPVGETAQLKDLAEKTFAWVREATGYPLKAEAEGGEAFFGDVIEVYALVDGKRKDKWLDAFGPSFGIDASAMDFYHKGSGWHRTVPLPYFITCGAPSEKNRARNTEEDFYQTASQMTSMIGRIVLNRIRSHQERPWLSEGMGFFTEIRFHETADCCYVTETKYREEVASKNGSKAKYFDFMKKQIQSGLDRPLLQVFSLDLNKLDWADSMKSWSFIEFLFAKYQAEFQKMLRTPFPEVEEITPEHVKAARLAEMPKDPAAAPDKPPREMGPLPAGPQKVSGPGAIAVTEGTPEQRAVWAAMAEAWITAAIPRKMDELEKEWKDWILVHP